MATITGRSRDRRSSRQELAVAYTPAPSGPPKNADRKNPVEWYSDGGLRYSDSVGRSRSSLPKARPELVEPVHEGGRIRELRAFGQRRLLEQHQREIAELVRVVTLLEVLHQVVIDVELEHRL